jgi:hypothetical protein
MLRKFSQESSPMKHTIKAILVIGTFALAAPASAQMVNGNNGANGSPEAPIGTKAGGSNAAVQAPGEAAAIAGAVGNEMDEKHLQHTTDNAAAVARKRNTAQAHTSGKMDNGEQ